MVNEMIRSGKKQSMQLLRIHQLHDDFDRLAAESQTEGYDFLVRMREEWISGKNQFSKTNEVLYAALEEGVLVGVCGLNIDPYVTNTVVGRLRHLYVSVAQRRKGIAKALVLAVLKENVFPSVRLRTRNPSADIFYRSIGFSQVNDDPHATHVWIG